MIEHEKLKLRFKKEPQFHAFMKMISNGTGLPGDLGKLADRCTRLNEANTLLIMRLMSMSLTDTARTCFFEHLLETDTTVEEFPALLARMKTIIKKRYISDKGKNIHSVFSKVKFFPHRFCSAGTGGYCCRYCYQGRTTGTKCC